MMAILIFGPRSVADTLARDLSRFHLFLQHPYQLPPNVVYDNPQYLSIVGSSFANGAILPPIAAEPPQQVTDRPDELGQTGEMDITAVMDNLPKHNYLKEAHVDGRVASPLLRCVLSPLLVSK